MGRLEKGAGDDKTVIFVPFLHSIKTEHTTHRLCWCEARGWPLLALNDSYMRKSNGKLFDSAVRRGSAIKAL